MRILDMGRVRRAFTITELLVVIAVIALILGIGLPAFNRMSLESRFSSATAQVAGVLTRSNVEALAAPGGFTLVRFVPATWEADPNDDPARLRNRQRAIAYRHSGATEDPADPSKVVRLEFFSRIEDGPEVTLPPDIWVAPVEALAEQTDTAQKSHLLNGAFGEPAAAFSWTWNPANPGAPAGASFTKQFLDADDFAVAFDTRGGVRRGPVLGSDSDAAGRRIDDVEILATDPTKLSIAGVRKVVSIRRRYFSGVVIYQREPFAGLGNQDDKATTDRRQQYLLRAGRPFYVDRSGGGLVSGVPR